MDVYAISDLHLSGYQPKPMDVFGENWRDHWAKIRADWYKRVHESDLVLIPGDISWAMRLSEALVDLKQIEEMPGTKIILKGNHDYWWSSLTRLTSELNETMLVLQNNAFDFEDVSIAGTRGWTCPSSKEFKAEDEKIYLREVERLRLSLERIKPREDRKIIAMMHYPPFNEKREPTGFTDLFEKFGVDTVLYGHLHDASAGMSFNGVHNGIVYQNVSCDFLEFKLKKVEFSTDVDWMTGR